MIRGVLRQARGVTGAAGYVIFASPKAGVQKKIPGAYPSTEQWSYSLRDEDLSKTKLGPERLPE